MHLGTTVLTVAASVLTFVGVTSSVTVCTNWSLLNDMHDLPFVIRNTSTRVQPELTLHELSLMKCARDCQLRTECRRFSFRLRNGQCDLFNTAVGNTTGISEFDGVVYAFNISSWPSALAGDCAGHTCPPQTVCINSTSCSEKQCINPPTIDNGRIQLTSPSQTYFDVGPVTFICDPLHYPKKQLTCLPDGDWTKPICQAIDNCHRLKLCNSNYTDGEYWLLPKLGNNLRARIYCDTMVDTWPVHFITLLEENYSESQVACSGSCGRTNYRRVKIDMWKLSVRTTSFYANGSVNCDEMPKLGTVSSCAADRYDNASACRRAGTFRVDLRGTGFRVNPDSQWTAAKGGTVEVTHSDSWDVVEGACYADTVCKTCTSNISVVLSENDQPAEETAVIPTCLYQ